MAIFSSDRLILERHVEFLQILRDFALLGIAPQDTPILGGFLNQKNTTAPQIEAVVRRDLFKKAFPLIMKHLNEKTDVDEMAAHPFSNELGSTKFATALNFESYGEKGTHEVAYRLYVWVKNKTEE